MTNLLEARDYYKPFSYPWAFRAYEVMFHDLHWGPHEAPMGDDIRDWNTKLTPAEKDFLTQLFRFFTQADVDIARAYIEKYMPRFPHPEVRMMMSAFAAAEANHIHAYATLIETLGMPESEFKAFQGFKAMKDKHDYMFERESGRSIADLAVDIACFSAFGEGMQLFSSFALLMNFQRRGLMKGMTTIVEWSIRDESLHVEAMIKLFHTLVAEHPRVWNDETKKRVYETCRQMVKLEDKFIEQAFSFGPVEGVTIEEAKKYIRYIADRRLLQLGLKANYHVKENPLAWLDWIMNAPTHTNFFEQRSTEYGKGEIKGWETAFDKFDAPRRSQVRFEDPAALPSYLVYTKPGCPHCVDAKSLLIERAIPHDVTELRRAEDRQKKFAEVADDFGWPGWNTSPMIFALDASGIPTRFVGGASNLADELNKA